MASFTEEYLSTVKKKPTSSPSDKQESRGKQAEGSGNFTESYVTARDSGAAFHPLNQQLKSLNDYTEFARGFFKDWKSRDASQKIRTGYEWKVKSVRDSLAQLHEQYGDNQELMGELANISRDLDESVSWMRSWEDYWGQWESKRDYDEYQRRSQLWTNGTNRLEETRRAWEIKPASDGLSDQERSANIASLESQIRQIDQQLARNERGGAYLGQVTTEEETRVLLQKRLGLGEALILAKKGGEHTDADILKQQIQNQLLAVTGQQGTLYQGYAANPVAGNNPDAYNDYVEQTRQLRVLEGQQGQLDYFQKYDGRTHDRGFWGQSQGNYDMGRLSQDSSMAWSEYLDNPTEENRKKAETIDQLMTQFQQQNWDTLNEDGKASLISKDLANYLPQFFDQMKYQAAGMAIAAPIALVAHNANIAKIGAVAGSGMYSMKSMQGAAFKALLEAGLDEATAMEAAKDEAVLSSLIEMGDTALDLFTMGGGKVIDLVTKGGLGALEGSVAKLAGKNIFTKFATALGKYGLNIFGEGVEEGTQGAISIANRERETNGANSKWELAREAAKVYWDAKTNRDSQYRAEINEQEAGGRRIAAMMGGVETLSNKITGAALQNHIYTQKYGGSVTELVKEGLEIDPENKLAQNLQKKLDNKKTVSGTEIAKLVEQNEATLRQRDTKTILEGVTERLKELGETGNIEAVAQALTNQAMGEKPTVADRKALGQSKFGQRVANEMNPANIRSGDYSSGWAREMETQTVSNDVFTGETSVRSVSKKLGFTREDTAFFEEGAKQTDLTEAEYALGVREAFQYGREGVSIDQIGDNGNAVHLDEGTRNYAYKLGRDARAMDEIRQQNKQEVNNGTEVRVRQGGQRDDGTYFGGQVPPVGGQTKAAAGEQRTAPGKPGAVGKDYGNVQRKVSARELGVAGGTDTKKIHLVENEDRRDMQRAKKVAREHGMEISFFEGGNLEIEAEDGHTFEARAYVDTEKGKMYVRADHYIPAHKLARHEAAHNQVANGQVDVDAVYDKMVELYGGERYVQGLIDAYAEAFAGSDMTAEEIFEEILCDSVAEINAFGQNKVAQDFQQRVKETVDNEVARKTEARGPPTGNRGKFSYAGIKARSADMLRLETAQTMEQEGQDSEAIRQKTGWFKSYDGEWRFEIDDRSLQFKELENTSNYTTLGQLITECQIFEAYPELREMPVTFQNFNNGLFGRYNRAFGDIDLERSLRSDPEKLREVLVHEIQHAVQHIEGFASGANENFWKTQLERGYDSRTEFEKEVRSQAWEEYNRVREDDPQFFDDMTTLLFTAPTVPRGAIDWDTLEQIEEDPVEWQEFDAKMEEMLKKYGDGRVLEFDSLYEKVRSLERKQGRDARELYYYTAGEVEARDSADRRDFTPEQRKNLRPDTGLKNVVFADRGRNSSLKFSREAKRFASEIEGWHKQGQDEDAPAFILGSTGDVLQGLGAIESDLYMWPWKINKILQKHPEISIDTIQKIPQILEDPIMILKSRNVGRGKQQNTRLVVYGNVKAEDGKPVMAILDLRPVENKLVINDMQKVSSAYTKDNDPVEFVKHSEILHLDKKRTPSLLRTIGFQAPIELQQSGSIGSISYEGQNVNLKGVVFSDVVQERTTGGKASREAVGAAQIEQSKNLQKQQLEYWLGKPKKRNGEFARPEDVRRVVRDVIGEYQSTVDRTETTKAMQKLADLIIKEGDEVVKKGYSKSGMTFDEIRSYAADIAWEVVGNSQALANEGDMELYDEIKSYLRKMPMRLTEESDIADFKDFRKRNFGRLLLKKDGLPIDTVWEEMQDAFGKGFFPDEITHPADMMLHLEDLLNSMEPVYYNPYEGAIPQNVEACTNTIVEKLFSEAVQPVSTYMDKELESLSRKIGENEQTIRALRQEQRHMRQENQRLREEANGINEYREARNKTQMRSQIRNTARELDKILNSGTKERNVKEGLRETAGATLRLAQVLFSDMRMETILNGMDTYAMTREEKKSLDKYIALASKRDNLKDRKQKLLKEAQESAQAWLETEDARNALEQQIKDVRDQMAPLADALQSVAERERNRLKGSGMVGRAIDEMTSEYRKLADSEEAYLRGAYDELVYDRMLQLKEDLNEAFVGDMTMKQLRDVYDILQMMMSTIRHANKMFVKGNMATLDETVFAIHTELSPKQKKNRVTLPKLQSVEQFHWNNEKPIYAFLRMGSDTLTGLYKNVRKGEDTWYVDTQEAKTFRLETEKKHGFKDWDFDKKYAFQSNTGMDFELSLQEIMSLYAYSKREQAWEHLMKGGFVFDPNAKRTIKTKHGIKVEIKLESVTAYNLSLDTWGDVINVLTKEQKAFVDEMQTYLADTMGGKGNEVSMELYGVKLFREKNYFPLRSAPAYNARVKEQQEGTAKIKNSGFTKETKPNAKNPIVLTPFMDLWADHVNEMSMYHGFTLPMEDFYRVYNFGKIRENTEPSATTATIQNANGAGAVAYIDQLLKDINAGKTADPREGLAKAMTAKFNKASVMASMSVLLRQFSAGPRAWAVVDPKYFVGRKLGETKRKAAWEEMKKYAPITGIKEMGYFDTGLGRSARDYLLTEEYEGFKEKSLAFVKDRDYRDEILGKAPAWADQVTWIGIWNAVKRETRDTRKDLEVGSEAFMQAVGERFTDVIQMTQVYDSVFARSANMRSGSAAMSAITAFMAEPTTTINMVEHAAREFAKGNKKAAMQTLAAVTTAIVLDSMLGSIVYAMRDDDEDKNLWEKYVENVTGNLLSGINLLTYIPFVKDIWSMLQGYDVERADMTIFGSCIDAVTAWGKLAMQDTSKMDAEALEAYKRKKTEAAWKVVDGLGALCGSSVRNIRRDALAFQNLFRPSNWVKSSGASVWDAVVEGKNSATPFVSWMESESRTDKLYAAILSGDTVYRQRLEGQYKNGDAVHTAIRKGLRENDPRICRAAEAWNSEDWKTYMDQANAVKENGFTQDDVVLAIRAEANELKPKEEKEKETKAYSLFTLDSFTSAILSGQDDIAGTIKKEILATDQINGKDSEYAEKNFVSNVKEKLKVAFMEGDVADQTMEKLLTEYCGMSQESAARSVAEWGFQEEYGIAYSDRIKAYKAGELPRSALKDVMMEIGGYSSSDADSMIELYDWENMDVPGANDMDKTGIGIYKEKAEPKGVSKESFTEFYSIKKRAKGTDLDGDGKKDAYSVVKEVMPQIGNLNISKEEKDALALCFWAEKTVRDYKTW